MSLQLNSEKQPKGGKKFLPRSKFLAILRNHMNTICGSVIITTICRFSPNCFCIVGSTELSRTGVSKVFSKEARLDLIKTQRAGHMYLLHVDVLNNFEHGTFCWNPPIF